MSIKTKLSTYIRVLEMIEVVTDTRNIFYNYGDITSVVVSVVTKVVNY